MNFGDVLNPRFKKNGELIGFQVRSELIQSMYLNSSFDLTHLRRILKLCIFMNKMLRDGRTDDFAIKQIKNGEVISSDSKDAKMASVEV